jgi:hypothetical protein
MFRRRVVLKFHAAGAIVGDEGFVGQFLHTKANGSRPFMGILGEINFEAPGIRLIRALLRCGFGALLCGIRRQNGFECIEFSAESLELPRSHLVVQKVIPDTSSHLKAGENASNTGKSHINGMGWKN